MIEKYGATLYKSENFAILEYCYDNYASNAYVKPYIEDFSTVQEETNILQEAMEEEIDETVSSLDEKDDEESEEQKEEERISYPCPLRESWIRGCSDSRTIPSSRTPGL